MTFYLYLILAILIIGGETQAIASNNCESGLSVQAVMDDGKLIKLDDGSLWEVDDADTVDSALWLPASDVLICGDKMTSIDDEETVEVTKIK
jgi:hypothetical protein